MADLRTLGREAWPKWQDEPGGAVAEPDKDKIIAFVDATAGAISDAAQGFVVTATTYAQLAADLSPDAGKLGRVLTGPDPVPPDAPPAGARGIYRKVGAAGSGSWAWVGPDPQGDTTALAARVDTAEDTLVEHGDAIDAEVSERTALIRSEAQARPMAFELVDERGAKTGYGLTADGREFRMAAAALRDNMDGTVSLAPMAGGGEVTVGNGSVKLIEAEVSSRPIKGWAWGITANGRLIGGLTDKGKFRGFGDADEGSTDAAAAAVQPVAPLAPGLAQIATRTVGDQTYSYESDGTAATYFHRAFLPAGCRGLLLALSSLRWATAPAPLPYESRVSADFGGALIPATFAGGRVGRVDPEQTIACYLPINAPPGSSIRIREERRPIGSIGRWNVSDHAIAALDEGVAWGAHAETAIADLPVLTIARLGGPVAILGLPAGRMPPASVFICDSSSFAGQGDVAEAPGFDLGYAARALAAIGATYVRASRGGMDANDLLNEQARMCPQAVRAGCEFAISHLAQNLIRAGLSLAEVQALVFKLLDLWAAYGLKVIVYTLTPNPSGPNGATRLAYNAWLRAGGLVHRALAGVIDVAAVLASPSDPSAWANPAYTGDDLHCTQLGHRTAAAATTGQLAAALGRSTPEYAALAALLEA